MLQIKQRGLLEAYTLGPTQRGDPKQGNINPSISPASELTREPELKEHLGSM